MPASVPTFTVHPGVACPPSPLMIIHNDIDADEDDDNEDDEPSVPLEQYRAWLGKFRQKTASAADVSIYLKVSFYLFSAIR